MSEKTLQEIWQQLRELIEQQKSLRTMCPTAQLHEHVHRADEIRNSTHDWSWRAAAEILYATSRHEIDERDSKNQRPVKVL